MKNPAAGKWENETTRKSDKGGKRTPGVAMG